MASRDCARCRSAIDRRAVCAWIILVSVPLALLLSLKVSVAGDLNGAPARPLELRGAIKDALGRPLAGAELRLEQGGRTTARAHSDSAGAFAFKQVAAGTYVVVANKPGFKQTLEAVVVNANGVGSAIVLTMEAKEALTLKLATERLDRARNDLAPEFGATAYRFDQAAIHRLPEGQNSNLAQVLQQLR